MNRSHLLHVALWPLLVGTGVAACVIERDVEREGGIHPPGFALQDDPEFHGGYLRDQGYPLADCRACHGDDYSGGAASFSCNQSGCHVEGVEWCGTCHDGQDPVMPESGSHSAHLSDCNRCHLVPKNARENRHPNGTVEVQMSGLAEAKDADPVWDVEQRRCQNTYCHGPETPSWDSPSGALECEACHATPPDSHVRFPLAPAPEGCSPCHSIPGEPHHLDGEIQILEPTCTECHGKGQSAAPPPALDGSTLPSSRAVGAHVRHLNADLSDRIGRAVECDECHEVPKTMRASGHLDESAPADVRFYVGSYDAETGSCVVGCHWSKDPGPIWTDTSGKETACDSCHGFPPVVTRTGAPHPEVLPSLTTCLLCHNYDVPTHIDGYVDFL